MQALVETIKAWQPHPAVDHFTIALVIVGILTDVVASTMPSRSWPRTTALTLMVAGAAAAWGSKVSGGWEAGRVRDNVSGPALEILNRHAFLGDWLPWAILALAIWRLGIQFAGFPADARALYLLVALVAGSVMLYQGHLGGELVYEYGVGTALMPAAVSTASPEPSPVATPPQPEAIPTVFNPSAMATPSTTASPMATPGAVAPSPAATGSPTASVSPAPAATPSAADGTPVNPPSGEASPAASPAASGAPKNL
jgi:uncharacterized membrane protein